MAQPPLTDPFFATEDVSNISNWVVPTPMDLPTPSTVTQEKATPHSETDQLVCSTPYRPCWRLDEGELVCVITAPSPINPAPNVHHLLPLTPMRERRRVQLEDTVPLPTQATTHQGGRLDLLVRAPLPMLHRMELLSSTVLQSLAGYEEWNEVVCGDVQCERTAQSTPHQTSDTDKHSNEVEMNFGTLDISEHCPHHYIPQQLQLPLETASSGVIAEPNINFSYPNVDDVEVECTHNGGDQLEDEGLECNTITEENSTPPTQQLVTGRIALHDVAYI